MTDLSQTELWVQQAKRGDRSALAKLLAVCDPDLRARAEARIDAAVKPKRGSDDILQEVYLDVVRQIDRFEGYGLQEFLNWASAILDHKLIDARRAAHRQVRDVKREAPLAGVDAGSYWDLLDHVYADSGTPSRIIRRQEALEALLVGLSDLSEPHRQVIELRFLKGLSVGEVAERLDKSEAAVVALTKRALTALRTFMDRLGEFTRGS